MLVVLLRRERQSEAHEQAGLGQTVYHGAVVGGRWFAECSDEHETYQEARSEQTERNDGLSSHSAGYANTVEVING